MHQFPQPFELAAAHIIQVGAVRPGRRSLIEEHRYAESKTPARAAGGRPGGDAVHRDPRARGRDPPLRLPHRQRARLVPPAAERAGRCSGPRWRSACWDSVGRSDQRGDRPTGQGGHGDGAGRGPKLAARIVHELKDKAPAFSVADLGGAIAGETGTGNCRGRPKTRRWRWSGLRLRPAAGVDRGRPGAGGLGRRGADRGADQGRAEGAGGVRFPLQLQASSPAMTAECGASSISPRLRHERTTAPLLWAADRLDAAVCSVRAGDRRRAVRADRRRAGGAAWRGGGGNRRRIRGDVRARAGAGRRLCRRRRAGGGGRLRLTALWDAAAPASAPTRVGGPPASAA